MSLFHLIPFIAIINVIFLKSIAWNLLSEIPFRGIRFRFSDTVPGFHVLGLPIALCWIFLKVFEYVHYKCDGEEQY